MTLQNRVQPDGQIAAHPARGMFMGNRGILHDWQTKTLGSRRWRHKAWITCLCNFKNRKRQVMGKGSYTELFFLDEVTAFAAGHRPCFECQRKRARDFQSHWQEVTGKPASAGDMDAVLHRQRYLSCKSKPSAIPARLFCHGMIGMAGNVFYAKKDNEIMRWQFDGYKMTAKRDVPDTLVPITAPVIVKIFQSGFEPVWHKSAFSKAVSALTQ